jgi:hypothetical protein
LWRLFPEKRQPASIGMSAVRSKHTASRFLFLLGKHHKDIS